MGAPGLQPHHRHGPAPSPRLRKFTPNVGPGFEGSTRRTALNHQAEEVFIGGCLKLMKTMFNLREGAVVAIIALSVGVFLTAPLASAPPSHLHVVLDGIANSCGIQKISDTNTAQVLSYTVNGAYDLTWSDTLLAWSTNGVGSFTVQYSGPPQTVTGNFLVAVVPAGGSAATAGVMTVNILGTNGVTYTYLTTNGTNITTNSVINAAPQVTAFVGSGDVQNPINNQSVGHAAATTWPVLTGGTATVTPGP